MKKITIKLPKGFKYEIKESRDTLVIEVMSDLDSADVKTKGARKATVEKVGRNSATGQFISVKSASKKAKVKAHKRSGTGGTGPRRKKK